jgi:hypothetical protein
MFALHPTRRQMVSSARPWGAGNAGNASKRLDEANHKRGKVEVFGHPKVPYVL